MRHTIREIVEQIVDIERRIEAEKIRHSEVMRRLDESRSEVQKRCTHVITKRHPDASGNNDSWTECEICGVVL